MTRNLTCAVLAAAAVTLLALAGLSCSKQESAETTAPESADAGTGTIPESAPKVEASVKIGIVTNAIAPFWDPMVVGMERAAKDPTAMPALGGGVELPESVAAAFAKITDLLKAKQAEGGLPPCEASWKGPQSGTLQEQRRLLEEFAAAGVDGISISPRESEPLTPVIDELIGKGTLVLCMDSDAPKSKRLAYIGTNNYEAGKMAGEAAGKVFGRGGATLIGFVGDRGAENAKERIQGFEEAAKAYKIVLRDVREDDADPAKARRNAEDVIQAFPDVNGFLGIWSYDAPAITQAVLAAKKQDRIKVVSFDAEPQTLVHLEKGEIEATIVQKPYLFGYLSVQLLYAMKVLGAEAVAAVLPEKGVIDTGVTVVTPDNVGEFMKYLDSLGVKSS
ncbi:MAG: substrate-binding domain-containing protein [Armatimonadetes bacterium]|nr:substrate-binding domain-containing protein [Armatimonadota bacterium]